MASSRSVPICGWAGLAGFALVGTCRPEAGRAWGVQIRLELEEHLFSGAFRSQLHLQQDHMTVIRPSAWQ
jgi:hypothetical protein